MAFNPIKAFSKFFQAVNRPDSLITKTMFNAFKKPVYKAAYKMGVRAAKLAEYLKQVSAKNMPSNPISDVDNYYRMLENAGPLGELSREEQIPFDLIEKEKFRRQRKYRYIVDGTKFDFGEDALTSGTYSFYTDKLVSLNELQETVNSRLTTIERYAGDVQAYSIDKIIAVIQNEDFVE